MLGNLILVATALIVGAILYGVWAYTNLMGKRDRVLNAWAQIDTQLKHRHDVIRDMVTAIRGYLQHDHQILENVSRDRLNAIQAGSNVPQRAMAENTLTQSVRTIFTLVDAYPALKENVAVQPLQENLEKTEERLAVSREFYNDAAREYDAALTRFPGVLMAERLGLETAVVFNLDNPPERIRPWVLR